jgi:hypothetical protein
MAQPEFAVMEQVTAAVLRRLTQLWVRLFGGVRVRPGVPAEHVLSPAQIRNLPAGLSLAVSGEVSIDFPQLWTDAVDNGVQEVIDAMDAAADSVTREVPAADTTGARAYRRERVRRAMAPSRIAKDGFAAVQEALAQPERLAEDVRGVVVGELVADHTDQIREELDRRGEGWAAIWVPERDACVRCLAYAGHWIRPGQEFPGGRTWGPRWKSVIGRPDFRGPGWRKTDDEPGEGMHPHCRCELRLVHTGTLAPMALALKREAYRSAAKGWARETEGDSVRVVAAKHALASAATLPESVVRETRRRLVHPDTFRRAVPSPRR